MFTELYRKFFPRKELEIPSAVVKSRHETMVECLVFCERMLGKKFSIRAAQVVQLDVVAPNILVMIDILKSVNAIMSKGQGIGPKDALFDWRSMSLANFFIDARTNNYINQSAYRDFHAQAKIFADLTLEGSTAEYGVHEHNYRVLSSIVLSIIKICKAIDEAQRLA